MEQNCYHYQTCRKPVPLCTSKCGEYVEQVCGDLSTLIDRWDDASNAGSHRRLQVPKYEMRDRSIYNAATGRIVCSFWPKRRAPAECLDGESWVAMRDRSQMERSESHQRAAKMADDVCEFLNRRDAFDRKKEEAKS